MILLNDKSKLDIEYKPENKPGEMDDTALLFSLLQPSGSHSVSHGRAAPPRPRAHSQDIQ